MVARVLCEFLQDPSEKRYGFEIMRICGISSGTLYPLLARLESAGWIVSQLEDIDPTVEGRRQRRYYTMTLQGSFAATQALNRFAAHVRLPLWVADPGVALGGA